MIMTRLELLLSDCIVLYAHIRDILQWEYKRPTTTAAAPAYYEVETAVVAPTTEYPTANVAAFKHLQVATTTGSIPATQLECCSFLGLRTFLPAVSSAGDQNWSINGDNRHGITGELFDRCDKYTANDSACADSFAVTHIISTVMFSVAAVVYTVAFFRPLEAQLGSTKVLGLVGGIITALATFFQMLAFISADKWVQENNEEWEGDFEKGPTFGVGVITFGFGFVQAILVLLSFSSAGDGPLLPLAREWTTRNEPPVPAHPSQTQAMMEQGAQTKTSIPQSTQNKASKQQGAILASPLQATDADKGPPPDYDSDDLEAKPPQPNMASKGPPPTYDTVDVGSSFT